MFLFIYLFAFICCEIPQRFKELANRALVNSKTKVPKELREDTKYPGYYEGPNYHYKLLKTISSSSTNDIKGFSVEGNYVAIVQRKRFNLNDNFTFLDSQNQRLYHLSKAIANEDNVIIYESEEITIFDIITNFKLENKFKTDDVPDYYSNSTKNPKLDAFSFYWNTYKNRPQLFNLGSTTMKYGCGANVKLSITAAFTFNSVNDIKIRARIDIESNFGGEFILPDDFEFKFLESRLLKEWSKAIPTIGKSFKILGFEIKIGTFFGLELHLSECKINIPIGFDYFKGYKLIGTKYYEVTPNSIMDSKWEINLLSYPEVNTANDIFRSMASAVFTTVFTLKPYVLFQISIGSKKVRLDIGLQLPLKFEMKFNSAKCQFPYLQGQLSLPMTMFYRLHELKISYWTIWTEKQNAFIFKKYVFKPFCIGSNIINSLMRAETIRTQEIELGYMYDLNTITFEEDEMEIMLKVPVWEGFNNKYLNIYTESSVQFNYEKEMRSFHEIFFYIKLSSEPYVLIKMTRNDKTITTADVEFYFFDIVTEEIQTLEKDGPTPVNLTNNVLYPMIIPLPEGDAQISFDEPLTFAPIIFYIDDDCAFVLIHSLSDVQCNMVPTYTYIGELEPIVTVDLAFLSPLLDIHGGLFSYMVNSDVDIVAKIGNRIIATSYISTDNGYRYVNLSEFGEITFIPICENETGIMCELTYPTPKMTGYHLVEYPNRDGISVTGSGFLRELIPVKEGQNFTYYKTSRESVKIIKEYPNQEIRVILNISDSGNVVQEDKFKKICIYREENNEEIIPFSRTYFTEHMIELYEVIGLKSDDNDFSKVTSDENGCLVFPETLKKKEIALNSIPLEICDIKIGISAVVGETHPTPKKKGLSPGAIAGIVVAAVVVVGLIIAVSVYFVHKRQKKIQDTSSN